MELIRGLHNVRPQHRGCIASIGNYDGVHRGHQAITRQLLRKSEEFGLPALIITFEPHPLEFFRGGDQTRITSLQAKINLLAECGIERVLCLRFNDALANMSAEKFMRDLLLDALGLRHLVVGDDFRFGKARAGDFEVLKAFGADHGFSVENTETFLVSGERVSSTRIRQALELGQLDLAAQLLGRRYSISGRVAHGDKLGRTWGFPTANINLQHQNPPLNGIYVVEVSGLGKASIPGVAYVGTRPTVDGTRRVLEIHLIDFNRDIYGERIGVVFLEKIRADQKFEDREALIAQITLDKLDAEMYFKRRSGQTLSK